MTEQLPIFTGIVGSHLHGLNTEDSDTDYASVFSYPTDQIVGLYSPPDCFVTTKPDVTRYELKKFLYEAAKCNPNVLEWFCIDTFTDLDPEWAPRLLDLFWAFVSEQSVRNSYAGMARTNLKALQKEKNRKLPLANNKRLYKVARTALRTLSVGELLLVTGTLDPKVPDPEFYLHDLPNLTVEMAVSMIQEQLWEWHDLKSHLPQHSNVVVINQYLIDFRKDH